jgi:hypothetical protein
MGIVTKMLAYDTCVYWGLQSNESGGMAYDDYGQPLYTDPVELKCRWEEVAKEFIDTKGTVQISRAIVYVESDVEVKGMLFHGELTDLDSGLSPRNQDGAWEIKRYDKLPHLKYKYMLRTAYL